jgi:hypothetical protein
MIGRAKAGDSTPMPFLVALTVIVVVLIGIGVTAWLQRGPDNEREAVVRAVLGQNDALQRLDYPDFRASTCAQLAGTQTDVLARQRQSVEQRGARYVENVTGVSVDGDRATATVIYYFGSARDDKITSTTTVLREDGSWRVCTAGP